MMATWLAEREREREREKEREWFIQVSSANTRDTLWIWNSKFNIIITLVGFIIRQKWQNKPHNWQLHSAFCYLHIASDKKILETLFHEKQIDYFNDIAQLTCFWVWVFISISQRLSIVLFNELSLQR